MVGKYFFVSKDREGRPFSEKNTSRLTYYEIEMFLLCFV